MTFGQALGTLKDGRRIARAGWNGKNMYLVLAPLQVGTVSHPDMGTERVHLEPCVVMFTAQGTYQPGWLASQADMLADDWDTLTDEND